MGHRKTDPTMQQKSTDCRTAEEGASRTRDSEAQSSQCARSDALVPKLLPRRQEANQIAQQVKAAFPGLFGFIGIDLIHNDNGLYIVDINPRLTTSYIALRTALNLNPMQRLFDIIEHKKTALSPITQRKTIKLTL